MLRPAAAGVGGDPPVGSEEVWEHLILHDASFAATPADTEALAHGARGAAHALEAPAAVHAWLSALEDEAHARRVAADALLPGDVQAASAAAARALKAGDALPNFVAFAARADATLVLAPSAAALAHFGAGPDVALVLGWPTRASAAAALAPEGPLAHGLLQMLAPDDLLWARLRHAAATAHARDTSEEADGATPAGEVRLRVAWQRSSSSDGSSSDGGVFLDVSLEAAPQPARSDAWQGVAGEWCAGRARAWGAALRPADDTRPWQVLSPVEAAPAARLYSAANGATVAKGAAAPVPFSAAETAAGADAGSRGVRLWFPAGDRAAAMAAADGLHSGRRRLLGSYYRELCATDEFSFAPAVPAGCASWYEDASIPWCDYSFGGSCNFCVSTSAEAGNAYYS